MVEPLVFLHLIPLGHLFGGVAKIHGGDPRSGIRMVDRAIALDPQDPMANFFYGGKAIGYFILHELDDAGANARRGIAIRYGYLFARVVLTASLVELGDLDEARRELAVILDIQPEFSPSFLDLYTFSNEDDRKRLISGIRAAGLEV